MMTYSEARKIAHKYGLSMYPCKPGRENDLISRGEEEVFLKMRAKREKQKPPISMVVKRKVTKDIYDSVEPSGRFILDINNERYYYIDVSKLPKARRKEPIPSGNTTTNQTVQSNDNVSGYCFRDY